MNFSFIVNTFFSVFSFGVFAIKITFVAANLISIHMSIESVLTRKLTMTSVTLEQFRIGFFGFVTNVVIFYDMIFQVTFFSEFLIAFKLNEYCRFSFRLFRNGSGFLFVFFVLVM